MQSSGCFAEMPATCGWHLPPGAGATELAETLRQIAEDPREIARRGAAAARFMGPRDAAAYADGLATFLHASQTRMARRAALAHRPDTPPDPQDRDWQRRYAQIRGMMAGLMQGRGLLPPDLWSCTDHEIGTYVSLNLLNTAVSDPALLGQALLRGGPLIATERLGLLRLLRGCARDTPDGTAPLPLSDTAPPDPGLSGVTLSDLVLPLCDPGLWAVILCLPPRLALPMGLAALGHRVPPETRAELRDLACHCGTETALITWLDTGPEIRRDRADMVALRRILHRTDPQNLRPLPPLGAQTDLIHLARDPAQDALHLEGFHPPEETGIWTARRQASIRAVFAPDHPACRLTGTAALLEAALTQVSLTLTITATEEQTGRHATWSDTRTQGSDPRLTWDLPLPRFSGPVRIDLSLPACHSPRDLGVSHDPRPLGVLLHNLHLENAPLRLEAAE